MSLDQSSLPLVWVTVAILAGGFARTRNRSAWYWFLLVLFFGPIAAACLVIWPARPLVRDAAPAPTPSDRQAAGRTLAAGIVALVGGAAWVAAIATVASGIWPSVSVDGSTAIENLVFGGLLTLGGIALVVVASILLARSRPAVV
ncbi:hypothetical protein [Frondihabitans peucedani]|uniref:Uncharacterized protein n=1 Tax=Frondihabitans peucedani TaxID=598626 RepID=A0ABP8DXV8_9MICO